MSYLDKVLSGISKRKGGDIYIFVQANSEYQVREEMYQGRKHLVVPVTMMVEGVHQGNRGPLYHSVEELGKLPDAWNGIPVTIDHPKDDQGEFVPANSPEIIAQYGIGRIFHTRMDGASLRAEAWLDEERLAQASQIAYDAIQAGEPLEVSSGMFSDEEDVSGEWNGETYSAISRNQRPDHLALLPGDVGACSWTDGCGIRTNMKGGKDEPMKRNELKTVEVNKEQYIKDLIANVEAGYHEVMQTIQSKLDSMDTDIKMHYLREVYDDYFVYEVSSRNRGESPKFYKRNYSTNVEGVLEFATEEPTEVRKEVLYIALKEGFKLTRDNVSSIINNKKEVNTMSKEAGKPCCEDAVNALIANVATKFADEDKEWLLTLKEDQVAKLVQNAVQVKKEEVKKDPPKEEATPPQLNAEQVKTYMKDSIKTEADFMEFLPGGEIKESLNAGLKLHKEQKASMVKSIIANTEDGLWKEDQLNGYDIETLTRIHKTIPTNEAVADYSLQGAHIEVSGGSKIEPMLPAEVRRAIEAKKE